MAANHYWYKGGWKCKSRNVQTASTNTTPTVQQTPATDKPVSAARSNPTKNTQVSAATTKNQSTSTTTSIENWLKSMDITRARVNGDNSIDVDTDVFLQVRSTKIPVKFNKVAGDFVCIGGRLKTLENAPNEVGGDLLLHHHHITSLVGGPSIVRGNYDVSNNPITSLEGIASEIGKNLHLKECDELEDLKNIHKYLKKIGGIIYLPITIRSNILGLLLIPSLEEVRLGAPSHGSLVEAISIVNKHLQGERDIHVCQEELIDAGLAAYAKL